MRNSGNQLRQTAGIVHIRRDASSLHTMTMNGNTGWETAFRRASTSMSSVNCPNSQRGTAALHSWTARRQTMLGTKYANFSVPISKSRASCPWGTGFVIACPGHFIRSAKGMRLRTNLGSTCFRTSSSPFLLKRASHPAQSSGACHSSGRSPNLRHML